MRLLVHGSGFKRPFHTDPEELRCRKPTEVRGDPKCSWSPSSEDWSWLGRSSGGSTPAATIDELVTVIASHDIETIDELRIVGHSNKDFLALAGDITSYNVTFKEPAMIGQSATFLGAVQKLRALQNRFTADARVVLAGCGSGGVGSRTTRRSQSAARRCTAPPPTPSRSFRVGRRRHRCVPHRRLAA